MIKALALLFERQPSTPSVLPPPRVPPKKISFKWAEHERLLRPSLRPPRPPVWLEHHPALTNCFFHSSALIGSSEVPYTASTFTWSVNKPRWRPSDTRAA